MKKIVGIRGSFDDIRARHIRFFQEASGQGRVHLFLEDDSPARETHSPEPRLPFAEREYYLSAIRYITSISSVRRGIDINTLPLSSIKPDIWCVFEEENSPEKRAFCRNAGIGYTVINEENLRTFPQASTMPSGDGVRSGTKKVLVTGCYDWFHSGHIRFFEEASEFGDLYVIVGSDANLRLLKGEGHPLFSEAERRYIAGAVKFVKQALVSTGRGWLDAEPEIRKIQPDIYVVNEDGDKPEKRQFCEEMGIEYVVLQRTPKEGLPKRTSTNLRGF